MGDASIDHVLSVIGFGPMQLMIFFGCATEQLYVTNEQFGLSLVTVAAQCDLKIDDNRMAWLMTTVFAAQVCCSHYMGFKSDEIGRRKILLISSMLSIVFSFFSSLMPEFWSFLVMRTIVGCFISGPSIAIIAYMSEFTKISMRPRVMNFLYYSMGISMILMAVIAMLLIPLDISLKIYGDYGITNWRVLMMLNLVPGLIAWIIIWFMPESPKYYLSINKDQEAYDILDKCCRLKKGKDVTLKSLGIDSVSQPKLRTEDMSHKCCLLRIWYETKPLLHGILLRYMLLIVSLLFLLCGTGMGLSVWMPRVFKMAYQIEAQAILCDLIEKAATLSISFKAQECQLTYEVLHFAIFNGTCCLVTFMLISVFLIFLNRKTILLAFSMVSALAGFMLNFAKINLLIVASFIFFAVLPLCSLRLATTVIIDVIPTHLRSKAVALAMTCCRVGVMAAHLFLGYVLTWNCLVTFNTFVVAMLVSFVLISRLPKDPGPDSI